MSRVPARAQAAFTPQAPSPVRAAHEARKPLLVPPFQIFQEYGGLAGNGQLIAPRRADNGASYAFSLRRGSDGFSPLRGSRQKVARLILAKEEAMQRHCRRNAECRTHAARERHFGKRHSKATF